MPKRLRDAPLGNDDAQAEGHFLSWNRIGLILIVCPTVAGRVLRLDFWIVGGRAFPLPQTMQVSGESDEFGEGTQ